MRGEGTCAVVSRSIAALRDWRSCTLYFTTNEGKTRITHLSGYLCLQASTDDHKSMAAPRAEAKHRKVIIERSSAL